MEQRGKGQERKDGEAVVNWVTRVKTALRSGTPYKHDKQTNESDAVLLLYTQWSGMVRGSCAVSAERVTPQKR